MRKLLGSFLLFLAGTVSAATIQVLPVQGADFSPDAPATLQTLVRAAVSKAGDTPQDSGASAQLRTSLLHLGQSYIVVCEKIENGQVTHSAQLKANNIDELDMVVERTVHATLSGTPVQSNIAVGSVTDREVTQVSKRTESRNYQSAGGGPAFMHGMDSPSMSYMLHTAYIWEAGLQGAITLQNNVALNITEWALHETLLIGGRYHFTATAVSPFLGGGLGVGLGMADRIRFGFSTGASLGVVFFRTSSTQLETALNYEALFDSRDEGAPAGKASAHIAINY